MSAFKAVLVAIFVVIVIFIFVLRRCLGNAEPGHDAGLASAPEVGLEVPAGEALGGVQPEDGAVVLQALSDDQRSETQMSAVGENCIAATKPQLSCK